MRLCLLIIAALSVATCGQKGPLYLPETHLPANNSMVEVAAAGSSTTICRRAQASA